MRCFRVAFAVLLGLAIIAIGGLGVPIVRIVVVECARRVHVPHVVGVAHVRGAQELITGRLVSFTPVAKRQVFQFFHFVL